MAQKIVLCDSDVLIDYWDTLSLRHSKSKQLLEVEIGLSNVALSIISCMELLNGARNKTDETIIKKRISRFIIIHVSQEISIEVFNLFVTHRLSPGLEIADCIIASTAKTKGLDLLTFNVKDYQFIDGLNLYKSVSSV